MGNAKEKLRIYRRVYLEVLEEIVARLIKRQVRRSLTNDWAIDEIIYPYETIFLENRKRGSRAQPINNGVIVSQLA